MSDLIWFDEGQLVSLIMQKMKVGNLVCENLWTTVSLADYVAPRIDPSVSAARRRDLARTTRAFDRPAVIGAATDIVR